MPAKITDWRIRLNRLNGRKYSMCCDWRLDATSMKPLCLLGARGPKEENPRTQRGDSEDPKRTQRGESEENRENVVKHHRLSRTKITLQLGGLN
jgi:hypothetical protein